MMFVDAWFAGRICAQPCAVAPIEPKGTDRAHVLIEAEAYVKAQRYAQARAMYRWMVGKNPSDRDASYALARLDAWERCFERANEMYRALVATNPADLESRAGLVDILLWNGKFAAAQRFLDAGMRLEPERAELWTRRAKLLLWNGDVMSAIAAADHAERLAPKDLDLRAFRDGLYQGQARLALRADLNAGDLPQIYYTALQVMQRWRRFDFTLDALISDREGGRSAMGSSLNHSTVDGRYGLNALYRANGDLTFGLGVGFGLPHEIVPRYELRALASAVLFVDWTAALSYSFWYYDPDKTIHIFAPAVTYSVTETLQLEARAWFSYLVVLQPPNPAITRWAAAVGLRGIWRVRTPLRLMLSYNYGPQLDPSRLVLPPTEDQLIFDPTVGQQISWSISKLQSHIVGAGADWLIARNWGLAPWAAFELRSYGGGNFIAIYTAELAAYVRW